MEIANVIITYGDLGETVSNLNQLLLKQCVTFRG